MMKIYTVDFYERLKVPENRIYNLGGIPISGRVQVYAINKKCNRISINSVENINNFIYIPNEFEIGSEIEIEYSYYVEGEEKKQMTKSDLKAGQKILFRNGREAIYFPNDIGYEFIFIDGGFMPLRMYSDNLKVNRPHKEPYDVISIWECNGNSLQFLFNDKDSVKWELVSSEEPDIKEVTIDEVEKKFGCKVKIVNKF